MGRIEQLRAYEELKAENQLLRMGEVCRIHQSLLARCQQNFKAGEKKKSGKKRGAAWAQEG